MLKANRIDENNLENYMIFYKSVILDGKPYEPIVLYTTIGFQKRWIRDL